VSKADEIQDDEGDPYAPHGGDQEAAAKDSALGRPAIVAALAAALFVVPAAGAALGVAAPPAPLLQGTLDAAAWTAVAAAGLTGVSVARTPWSARRRQEFAVCLGLAALWLVLPLFLSVRMESRDADGVAAPPRVTGLGLRAPEAGRH